MNINYNTSKFSCGPTKSDRKGFHCDILDCDGKVVATVSGSTIESIGDNSLFFLDALNDKVKRLPKVPKSAPFKVGDIVECTDPQAYLGAKHPTKGNNTPIYQKGLRLRIVQETKPTKHKDGASIIAWMDGVIPKDNFSGKPFGIKREGSRAYKKVKE